MIDLSTSSFFGSSNIRHQGIRKRGLGIMVFFLHRAFFPLVLSLCLPTLPAQVIKVTLPRPSTLTPVQRLNREGVEAVVKHHYEAAESLFNKAYLFDPTDPFTLTNLGYISELQGQSDRAESFYRLAQEQGCYATIDLSTSRALKNKPMVDALGTIQNLPMRINRMNIVAMGLLSEGRSLEAVTLLETTLALEPANPFTLNDLGVAQEALGNVESALRYYDRASATQSKEPIVVTLKRAIRGKPISEVAADSASDLRARTQSRTGEQLRAAMLTLRGVTAVNRNDWVTARQSFVDAYALDPHSAFTINNLGYLAEHDGNPELAKAYYTGASNARDADQRVGLTTQTSSYPEEIAAIASRSQQSVGAALDANAERRRHEPGQILLKRRGPQEQSGKPIAKPEIPRNITSDAPNPIPPQ